MGLMLRRVRHTTQGWRGLELEPGPPGAEELVNVQADLGAVPRWLHRDDLVDDMDRKDWGLVVEGLAHVTPKSDDQGRRLHRLLDWAEANRQAAPQPDTPADDRAEAQPAAH